VDVIIREYEKFPQFYLEISDFLFMPCLKTQVFFPFNRIYFRMFPILLYSQTSVVFMSEPSLLKFKNIPTNALYYNSRFL
jgi:hypothetical protein